MGVGFFVALLVSTDEAQAAFNAPEEEKKSNKH
jgi:hypothetical protein